MRNISVVLLCLLTVVGAGCGSETPGENTPPPGISLRVDISTWPVQAGTRAGLPVIVGRSGGYEGPIQVGLRGLPEGSHDEAVRVLNGQTDVVLPLELDASAVPGAYPIEVVALGEDGLIATAALTLDVAAADAVTGTVHLSFESGTPVLNKGTTHQLFVAVERRDGFQGGFRVEPQSSALTVGAVEVAAEATRFALPVSVYELLPVGRYPLVLTLRSGAWLDYARLEVDVTAPVEGAPQLTAANPPDVLQGVRTQVTLTGSGLSGATSVVLRPAQGDGAPVEAGIFSAGGNELKVSLQVPSGDFLPSARVLEVTTGGGTVTLPFEVSVAHVDPATGSDTAGRGTRTSPFASILKARTTCSACVWPRCGTCPIQLAPGVHRPGRIELNAPVKLVGLGELYGANPSVIEGVAGDRLTVTGVQLENLKVTGFDKGVEARYTTRGDQLLVSELTDVWLTGNGYGLTSQAWVTVSTRNTVTRIENNRIGGVSAFSTLKGSADHPIEITGNGDGTENAGGILGAVERAEHVRVERNRGAGAKVLRLTARDSTFRDNTGPGVWVAGVVTPGLIDLGTAASPGGNTLKGNSVNLRVDQLGNQPVTAAGNCWEAPAEGSFPEAVVEGECGRLGTRFEWSGIEYIDAQGRAQVPFTWSGTPRFNYSLAQGASGAGKGIQF